MNALRAGLVRYDRRHGWRGAKNNISVDGDWKGALANAGNHRAFRPGGWRWCWAIRRDRAVRIGLDDGTQAAIPFEQLAWARPEHRASAGVGAAPSEPQDVVKAGDVDVRRAGGHRRPLRLAPGAGDQRRHRGDGPAYRPRASRCPAASASPPASSTAPCRRSASRARPSSRSSTPRRWTMATRRSARCWMRRWRFHRARACRCGRRRTSRSTSSASPLCDGASTLSRNLMTIRLAHDVGMDKVVQYPHPHGRV